jgi:hypothetical protein
MHLLDDVGSYNAGCQKSRSIYGRIAYGGCMQAVRADGATIAVSQLSDVNFLCIRQ